MYIDTWYLFTRVVFYSCSFLVMFFFSRVIFYSCHILFMLFCIHAIFYSSYFLSRVIFLLVSQTQGYFLAFLSTRFRVCTERNTGSWWRYLDPTENYFHIDNKRILLLTIKQVITSVQIRYNLFYECANKLYDC